MDITFEGNVMVIRFPMDTAPRASASGKSRIVFTTGGSPVVQTPLGLAKVGVNVFTQDEGWAKAAKPVVAKPGLVKAS